MGKQENMCFNKLSVITINYNGLDTTKTFLKSFHAYVHCIEYEMIVIDNGSKDNESVALFKEFPWIKCIRSEENLGFSGGNNLGVKYATGDIFLFLNNDLIVTFDFVESLLKIFSNIESVGIVSPKILNIDNTLCYGGSEPLGRYLLRIHYIYGDIKKALPISQEVSLAHGAALMIEKKVIERLGGWPEVYFLYSEEVDLSINVRKLGYSIWYEPKSFVYHLGSQSTGKESPLVYYYNTRNRFLLYKRNLRGLTQVISVVYQLFVVDVCLSLKLIANGQYHLFIAVCKGVKDFICGNFYKGKC